MRKGNWMALLPIGVFLAMYLGLGILFEYILDIPMGFYKMCIRDSPGPELGGASAAFTKYNRLLCHPAASCL